MIIKDYKTPEGRLVITERTEIPESPCYTRKMTEEEMIKYKVEEWRRENLDENGENIHKKEKEIPVIKPFFFLW